MDETKEDGLTLKAIDSDHLAKCWYQIRQNIVQQL